MDDIFVEQSSELFVEVDEENNEVLVTQQFRTTEKTPIIKVKTIDTHLSKLAALQLADKLRRAAKKLKG